MNNKHIKLLFTIIILILVTIVGIIFIKNSKSNHNILLKLTKDIEWTDDLGAKTNKKIYVSVYDGKQIKKYESTFNKNLSKCLLDIEKKLDCDLYQKYIRLDITAEEYEDSSLIKMANNNNTLSYYYENGKVYDLTKYEIGKARDIKSVNIKENVIINTYHYMLRQIQSNGEFIYGVNLNSGKTSNDYNIIRYSGSLWSLLENYNYLYVNGNKEDLKLIKSAYDYIYNNNLQEKDENTDFIFTDENTCKIGSNALMILASIELYDITGEKNI